MYHCHWVLSLVDNFEIKFLMVQIRSCPVKGLRGNASVGTIDIRSYDFIYLRSSVGSQSSLRLWGFKLWLIILIIATS